MLGVGGIAGDHRVVQVNGVQQFSDLGGLGRLVRDPVLGDHHLLLVQHRGEQLDLPVRHAPQPFAVDRDRGQQPVHPARVRHRAQPAADQLVQLLGADALDQGADPLLARHDDRAAQRPRLPAEPGQDLLWQVSGLVADLPEILRPGQHARHRDRQDEHQAVSAAPAHARVRHLCQHLQQARDLTPILFIGAGHGGSTGMRHWHRRPFVPVRSGVDTRDQTGREAAAAKHAQRRVPLTVSRRSPDRGS